MHLARAEHHAEQQYKYAACRTHQVYYGVGFASQRLHRYVGHQRNRRRAEHRHGNQRHKQQHYKQHQRPWACRRHVVCKQVFGGTDQRHVGVFATQSVGNVGFAVVHGVGFSFLVVGVHAVVTEVGVLLDKFCLLVCRKAVVVGVVKQSCGIVAQHYACFGGGVNHAVVFLVFDSHCVGVVPQRLFVCLNLVKLRLVDKRKRDKTHDCADCANQYEGRALSEA